MKKAGNEIQFKLAVGIRSHVILILSLSQQFTARKKVLNTNSRSGTTIRHKLTVLCKYFIYLE